LSVTIKDVARLAGVSVATVSRVLNSSAPVREETRDRVLAVAKELRFAPNSAARSLSRRRAGALGVILPDLYGEFFSELLRGIDQESQRAGHSLLVSSSHHDSHGVGAAVRAMRGRVDGLLVMAPEVAAAALEANLPDGLAVVLLNPMPGAGLDSITVDNAGGARLVVQHLAAMGHGRIAFITGPTRNADAQGRLRGYRAAMRAAGLPVDDALVARGEFTEESGWRAAHAIVSQPGERPTAIFAANDASAVGALAALREAGVSVPEEMAVVGFDDIPIARYATPPLTTVRVAIDVLGARAATLLLRAITGPARRPSRGARREIVPAELVVRASCGPPPPPALSPARSVQLRSPSSASLAFSLEKLS
jgi:LacI family transcriptional regulator